MKILHIKPHEATLDGEKLDFTNIFVDIDLHNDGSMHTVGIETLVLVYKEYLEAQADFEANGDFGYEQP